LQFTNITLTVDRWKYRGDAPIETEDKISSQETLRRRRYKVQNLDEEDEETEHLQHFTEELPHSNTEFELVEKENFSKDHFDVR
jgi:hypothetical protein